jgi:hypothetical protein
VHQKLLEKENILIRNIGKSEREERSQLKEIMINFCQNFMLNVDTGISDIVDISERIEEQFHRLEHSAKGIKSFDNVERKMIRGELSQAKNAITSIKKILDKDRKPFGAMVNDFKELYQIFEEKFETYADEVEEQAERYARLCELKMG